MLDVINEVALHLGRLYQAGRVVQDSGLWLYDVEAYARYTFARLGLPVVDR